jgi:predicted MFS family arabinose efflux permease
MIDLRVFGFSPNIPVSGVPLGAWVAVLICWRLITFFRPGSYH